MLYEWDIYKAIANLFKHGISFSQAATALEDPYALIIPSFGKGEMRIKLIGEMSEPIRSDGLNVIVVIYLVRQKHWRRIISARPAKDSERREYEERR